jgi:hypothetical protein
MLYEFQDDNKRVISQHQNRDELIKSVRAYYKGEAIDNDESEYEIVGDILKYNHLDEVETTEDFYEVGKVAIGRNSSPYQQSEFI